MPKKDDLERLTMMKIQSFFECYSYHRFVAIGEVRILKIGMFSLMLVCKPPLHVTCVRDRVSPKTNKQTPTIFTEFFSFPWSRLHNLAIVPQGLMGMCRGRRHCQPKDNKPTEAAIALDKRRQGVSRAWSWQGRLRTKVAVTFSLVGGWGCCFSNEKKKTLMYALL